MTVLSLGILCTGCVDPDFNLGDIKVSSVAFQNLEVPIGNFEEIKLSTILNAPGASMLPLVPGTYALSGSAEITGINFQFDEQVYFKEAELHTVVINTIPLDMSFSVTALNAGVKNAVIMDGRVPHSILMELLTNEGAGTWLRRDEA